MENEDTFLIRVDSKVIISNFDDDFDGQTGLILGFEGGDEDEEEDDNPDPEDYFAIVLLDEPSVKHGVRAILVPVMCLDVLVAN
jgi:hypothetical protein